jgi:hypothetical protein
LVIALRCLVAMTTPLVADDQAPCGFEHCCLLSAGVAEGLSPMCARLGHLSTALGSTR